MGKWQRFKYLPVKPLGENGRIVTGCREHICLSRKAAAEGMVLLKNENRLLPLKKGSRVALFGKASADYVKGGGGSGDVTAAYIRNLCDGMEEKAGEGKVDIFPPLHEFYRKNVAGQRSEGRAPGHTVEPDLPEDLAARAAAACDTAIISICRFSSEERDRMGKPGDGDFYLSPAERKMVEAVCARFHRIVVVLNVGGMVDTSWLVHNPKIQAVLLAWQGGMEGAMAEADILCGDVNPSGKLTDTFAASFDDYPSSLNFNESADYVCYTDDIFVGYRYFETVPGAAEKVNYSFGFGLSYTSFRLETLEMTENGQEISVAVRVTNTGAMAGKEVVQVYSSAPKCRLEMPKLELRAFQKTRLLAPGEAQDVTLTFRTEKLAAYDEKLAAYVLQGGVYTILVGSGIRELTVAGRYHNPQERVTEQIKNRCVPNKLPWRLRADGSHESFEMREDPHLPDTAGWPEKARWEAEHILPDRSGIDTPEGRLCFEKVASGEVSLDAFLDSLTDAELVTLLGGTPNRGVADTRGIGGIDDLGIPAVMTADGPAGLRINPDRGVTATAWPVATLLACTWDPDTVYKVGEAAAKEVRENNIGIWLTPAINIHRSPLCGRNFEYYSEDPLLSGKLAAAMVRGIQSQRISACVKHFCCNNKETNRFYSDSRVSERALREIYLEGFRIVVQEGGVWSLMTSYNRMNGVYTSENRELLQGILREEWGYEGLVVTDWDNRAEHYREVLAGNNVRMPYGSPKRLQKALELGRITREDLLPNVRKLLEFLLILP